MTYAKNLVILLDLPRQDDRIQTVDLLIWTIYAAIISHMFRFSGKLYFL